MVALLLLLQTAKSLERYQRSGNASDLQVARDMTCAEFRDNFLKMLWVLDAKLQEEGMEMAQFKPYFSWDHNRPQEYADLAFTAAALPAGMDYVPGLDFKNVRMPLGKYSPDCHRVIEHVFGQLSAKLRKEIVLRPAEFTSAAAIAQWVQQHFFELEASSIRNDAEGLKELYEWVVSHGGSWAPRRMR